MMHCVKYCAPPTRTALWRTRVLAFLGTALVGLVVPAGCVVVPEGGSPSRASIQEFFCGPNHGCPCDGEEATCGAPSSDSPPASCTAECTPPDCGPTHRKWWDHLPKCHLYDPEAGIFNFCIPPQCLNPPPPLPPGRFFPVPVRPAFAERGESDYSLLNHSYDRGGSLSGANAPCQ
jgi:hypothetical protein